MHGTGCVHDKGVMHGKEEHVWLVGAFMARKWGHGMAGGHGSDTSPPPHEHLRGRRDGQFSGQYASYWNAFLCQVGVGWINCSWSNLWSPLSISHQLRVHEAILQNISINICVMLFSVNMSINLAEQTLVLSLQRVKNSTPLKQDRTRLHSSRVRTARSLPYGGFRDRDPPTWTEAPPTPGQRPPPWTETSLWTDRSLWKYYLVPSFVCGW